MQNIEVKSKEYKIVDMQDNLTLYTKNLNSEIAYTAVSIKLKKLALARNLTNKQLEQFFIEFNPGQLLEPGLIKLQVVGGNNTEESQKFAEELVQQMMIIDSNTNMLDITSFDVCKKFHPNSFELDCYHGGVRPIE